MRSGLWLLLLLSLSCDSLWGGLVKNNPENCMSNTDSCAADEMCSPVTERCVPLGKLCGQDPSVCTAAQTCSPDTMRCVSKLVLTQLMPAIGPSAGGGTPITITGDFFQTGITVFFDGVPASNVIFLTATTLKVTLPAHARYSGPANVKLVQPDSTTVSRSDLFSYYLSALDFTTFKDVTGINADNVLVADLNRDPQLDLAALQDTTINVSLGNGNRMRFMKGVTSDKEALVFAYAHTAKEASSAR